MLHFFLQPSLAISNRQAGKKPKVAASSQGKPQENFRLEKKNEGRLEGERKTRQAAIFPVLAKRRGSRLGAIFQEKFLGQSLLTTSRKAGSRAKLSKNRKGKQQRKKVCTGRRNLQEPRKLQRHRRRKRPNPCRQPRLALGHHPNATNSQNVVFLPFLQNIFNLFNCQVFVR